ncbi:4Fe-4S binding protein [Candidatus Poribacteria bacterium]|nr:4Fe-4S binding protein [Candidatus Poribacteria bacterium]
MLSILLDEPGKRVLMMGNEAIARGAIEAGMKFCAAYPGSPSSEIIGTLARPDVAENFGHHAEWSTNEVVALEAAAGASFGGLRALCAMKQNGINVASDFLMSVVMSGCKGGLVLVVADDPGAHCSNNEMDSRAYARLLDAPLLEPATIEESKEMTRWAFELSEELEMPCMIRSVTRISHARGDLSLGPINRLQRTPRFEAYDRFLSLGTVTHSVLHGKLEKARDIFEKSQFNQYVGPSGAELVIITCGTGWLFSREALRTLGLEDKVGILKLATTWPLPNRFIVDHLKGVKQVLFVEEIDPFMEQNVKSLLADYIGSELEVIKFFGKGSGHVRSRFGPALGEIDPDIVIRAVAEIKGVDYQAQTPEYAERASTLLSEYTASRDLAFCAGCPHRASYWVMKNALALDGRGGFVLGDIGCYGMGAGRSGYFINRTLHCMGSGAGVACGLGNLAKFEFDQPVVAVMGDSTFFHAALPALINARYNGAKFTSVVLDNSATAMTGFQPHPGIGLNAMGNPATQVLIEDVCKGLGFHVEIRDPFKVDEAVEALHDLMQREESSVLILRHTCGLVESRKKKKDRISVNAEKCLGDECGCARFCTRVFGCPALIWNEKEKHASVDEVVCTGCGVCAYLCPQSAIEVEKAEELQR